MLSLDTNILVYSADRTAGPRYIRAKEMVHRAAPAGAGLAEQSLFEFFHACTRKGKMTVSEAAMVVQQFSRDFAVLLPNKRVIGDTLEFRARHRLSIWDARLLVICNVNGCSHLLSEDLQDGGQYGAVTVVNPFDAANSDLVESLLQ